MNKGTFFKSLYTIGLTLSYILIIVGFFIPSQKTGLILNKLEIALQIYIALFLIIYFNPFVKPFVIDSFSKNIIFSAGILLIFTQGLKGFLINLRSSQINNIGKTISENTKLGELTTLSDIFN